MTDHDAELEAIVAMMTETGLLEEFTDENGEAAMWLTPEGERAAQQLAMSGKADAFEALLVADETD